MGYLVLIVDLAAIDSDSRETAFLSQTLFSCVPNRDERLGHLHLWRVRHFKHHSCLDFRPPHTTYLFSDHRPPSPPQFSPPIGRIDHPLPPDKISPEVIFPPTTWSTSEDPGRLHRQLVPRRTESLPFHRESSSFHVEFRSCQAESRPFHVESSSFRVESGSFHAESGPFCAESLSFHAESSSGARDIPLLFVASGCETRTRSVSGVGGLFLAEDAGRPVSRPGTGVRGHTCP